MLSKLNIAAIVDIINKLTELPPTTPLRTIVYKLCIVEIYQMSNKIKKK